MCILGKEKRKYKHHTVSRNKMESEMLHETQSVPLHPSLVVFARPTRFYFGKVTRKLPSLVLSSLTPVDASLPPFISFAHSRIRAASPPLLFLSAWKDGCSGGGEKLRPGALPELRGGLFVPGAIRSGAGSTRDDFPADGEVSAGHRDR